MSTGTFYLFFKTSHGGDGITFGGETHEDDALGSPAELGNVFERKLDDLGGLAGENDLIDRFVDGDTGDDLAGFGGDFGGFDALATSFLERPFFDAGSFTQALVHDNENVGKDFAAAVGRFLFGGKKDFHADDEITGFEVNTPDAHGIAGGGADVLFFEPDGLAVSGDQENVVGAGGGFDPLERVTGVEFDGNFAGLANGVKFRQLSLFDGAGNGSHEQEFVTLVLAQSQDGLQLFALVDIDEIDDGLAFGLAAAFGEIVSFDLEDPALVGEK